MIIEFHPDVHKQLQRLPRKVFASALDRIIALVSEPRPHDVKKLVGSANEWRIRIGEYRIIYEINDRAGVVTVLNVDKRSDVYK